jgi:DNA repair ATPase RecN
MFKSKKSEQLLSEIELLLPNLRALVDRASMIDDIHHRMKLLESISHNLNELANTASLLSTADSIVSRYLNDGHRIADDVRVDVETISALTLKLQKELQDLSRRLTDFEARLSG